MIFKRWNCPVHLFGAHVPVVAIVSKILLYQQLDVADLPAFADTFLNDFFAKFFFKKIGENTESTVKVIKESLFIFGITA